MKKLKPNKGNYNNKKATRTKSHKQQQQQQNMYEKTLTQGTTKVNNAYEWQKVKYNNNNSKTPTTTTAAAKTVKVKQQQQQPQQQKSSAKNATKTTSANTNLPLQTCNSITVKSPAQNQSVKIKFVGNAARRQTLAHQIKRAHRHLLTSGGNDKKPTQQKRNFSYSKFQMILNS